MIKYSTVHGLSRLLPGGVRAVLFNLYWQAVWREERQETERAINKKLEPLRQSERAMLIEAVCREYPMTALLEVGCGYAQNFPLFSALLPEVDCVGIDRDAERIAGARQVLGDYGCLNNRLLVYDATDLHDFPDKSFDVVLSCGFLLFVEPNAAVQVVQEMVRLARRKLLFMELHTPTGEYPVGDTVAGDCWVAGGGNGAGYWLRDFNRLLEHAAPGKMVSIEKVPKPLWPTQSWKKDAYLIAVDCS